jgi:uncharacterized membrane protein
MSVIEKTVEVQCPLSKAYNQWTQFETFPRFMEGVEEVKQIDAARDLDRGGANLPWNLAVAILTGARRIVYARRGSSHEGT